MRSCPRVARLVAALALSAAPAAPALAGQDIVAGSTGAAPHGGRVVTAAEIRSGLVVDDGLDIPHIRPGTQYFEIHGSTRIARALGEPEHRLPTDEAGLMLVGEQRADTGAEPPSW